MVKTISPPKVKKVVKPVKSVKSSTGIQAPLFNVKAEKIGEVSLPKTIFGVKIHHDLIALSTRSFLDSQRTAHAKIKERGEVAGTTKKMWAQKGTGRARHGSAKVGIFIGGGSVHGPRGNQKFTVNINQKARKLALYSVFSQFAKDSRIIIIDDFTSLPAKTRSAWTLIDGLEKNTEALAKSGKIGIILEPGQSHAVMAFRNIPGISTLSTASLNVYTTANQNFLIISQKALDTLS